MFWEISCRKTRKNPPKPQAKFPRKEKEMRWLVLLATLACVGSTGVATISEMLFDPRSSALMNVAMGLGAVDVVLGSKPYAAVLAAASAAVLLLPLRCRLSNPGCLSATNAPWLALHFGAAAVLVASFLASLRVERRDLFAVAAPLAALYPPLCVLGALYGNTAAYAAGCACQLLLVVVYAVWIGDKGHRTPGL